MRWAEFVERSAGVRGIDDLGKDCSRLGRCLRQLDIVLAHTFIGETPGLQMPGEGQHRLRELEIGPRECVRAKPGKIGRAIIAYVEAICIGILEAGNHRRRARIRDTPVEPKGSEGSTQIEGFDRHALVLAGENRVRLGGQEITNLFRHHAVSRI